VQSFTAQEIGIFANAALMADIRAEMIDMLDALASFTGSKLSKVATDAGLTPSTLTRYYNNADVKHELSTPTIAKLKATYPAFFAQQSGEPLVEGSTEYVAVEVLPTFAGMGGGGTGEGDPLKALVSRALVEDHLRAKAADLLLIEVRGDSMTPDFIHGDQILVDRRDRNPRQPGAFALFDGDGIVVKLVERIASKRGWYRVFSANPRYTPYEVEDEQANILGRPVWFARRL
jgi:phage repressor protein C with HTH and peptisase S24 domain